MGDSLGALVPGGELAIDGAAGGPLAGVTFVAKDIFDVAGTVTGRGNPDWRASHPPAERHAAAIAAWLGAGAHLRGKAVTEELAFSIVGINPYDGAPRNSAAPSRVAGGSSSGSAAAVGGGLVDLALGSDTGGSVRVPASYNGILGMRPSHGRISLDGVMPLAPSFDTVGWFGRDPARFAAAGRVLIDDPAPGGAPTCLLLSSDAFARTEAGVAEALAPAIRSIKSALDLGPVEPVSVSGDRLDEWYATFRTIQGAEAWAHHGPWIRRARPQLGPLLRLRLDLAAEIGAAEVAAARQRLDEIRSHLDDLLGPGGLLILPSAAGIAPPLDAPVAHHEAVRDRAIAITCIASLGGLPQLSLPLAQLDAAPVGVSLIAPRGADALLLDLVERLAGIGRAAGVGQ